MTHLMARHFEPSRVLENAIGIDNEQQYVEIGSNTFLGTKDGIRYALFPTSDNKVRLCEIPNDSPSMNLSASKNSWGSQPQDEVKNDTSITPRAIKLVAVRKEPAICKGQGDESGNSIISTPDSTSRFKNADNSIPEKYSDDLEGHQIHLEESPPLTYTTLVPKQEKIEDVTSVTYSLPQNTFFQVPQPQLTPISSKPTRFVKPRQRLQMVAGNSQFPPYSPITHATRGHRQRRPRQVWYQYRTPLQSTPNSVSGTSLSCTPTTPSPLTDASGSSSITRDDESQVSLEYPRVPNNTPNSEGESSKKIFDLQQWIPQIHSRTESFVQMDPRESHNEKERKRRLRIKIACQYMKSLLPCVCDKTDNATVFENAVHFIAFMKETVGSDYDMVR
ncbi:BHLH domain-containing protein [Nephila pilipes]|uniref:BHLH domain-containing protein n=2 Tax=Nephila pilipes TaxID=299642 RepID=A0A8X6QEM1_NEPPI|nr:BHLH domain-containing protein [Nephila pilipes]